MAAGPVGVKHPAKILYTLAALMALLAFVLSLIAVFVPWSWKDTGVFQRWYVGLWKNWTEITNAPLNDYMGQDNDVDQVGSVCGGSQKCRGYFIATQVLTIMAVCFSFLTLVLAALIIGKLWSKPIVLGLYLATMALCAFGTALAAFLCWIVYVETNCQPGNTKFPIKNYSWGWICMVCATFFAFLAMLLAYLGLCKTLMFKPFIPHEDTVMESAGPMYVEQPFYEPVPVYDMPGFGGMPMVGMPPGYY